MREGDVNVGDGVRIHYVDGGARDAKRTLLFVPGWCTSADIWRDPMQEFSSSARVVSIDPRSQGRSTVTPRGNTPERRAQDLRQVIRALGLGEVVLVGWSQGVQDVAAYAAAFHGEGVAGYVLVDAALGAGAAAAVAQPAALKQQLERLVVYQQHPKEYLEGMMNAIIQSPEGRSRIAEYIETGLRTPPDLGISMLLVDIIAYDRRPALASFDRPTLIIASAVSDELEAQRAMAKQIPGAEVAVIENAGHAVFLDQPQRFRELLEGFLRRLTRP
jgi:pimeloyl-ACP methyl ester carboxylesterase